MTFPRLVAVTDDARLAAEGFSERMRALLDAGLPALWLRGKALEAASFFERAQDARLATELQGAELWIGDRADVASLVGADRLHLPEEGVPLAVARRVVGEGMPIGRSVHGVEAARRAATEGVDHLVVGTIFSTASHPDVEPGGPERVAAVREALGEPRERPLYAIGGLDPSRVEAAMAAGADGVVALRALWESPRPVETVAAFLDALGDR
ncbi:MAG: thiamine phosphate synthase [Gemmatimonadota bacterium]|nr:thiamine phosphate synthase [Gemmatimonadota bacterium]